MALLEAGTMACHHRFVDSWFVDSWFFDSLNSLTPSSSIILHFNYMYLYLTVTINGIYLIQWFLGLILAFFQELL